MILKPQWRTTVVLTLFRSASKYLNQLSQGVLVALAFCFLGCASQPPKEQYNLAFAAMEGARAVQATKYAPALWYKAEEAYRRAEDYYKKEDYTEAEKNFVRARSYAERAENASRLKRFETGEGVL